ncbi:MAG: RNA-binding domain-containing protein [Halobacteriales archaeon]|nr:RNA-binding domain-containing protein [Halobacteriales archaeon]
MTEETDITVRTKLYRTESREKVEDAVRNLFPDAEFDDEGVVTDEEKDEDVELVAEAGEESVERLRELVDRQEINETAYEQLTDAVLGDTLAFSLSKQPATAGRVNFDVGGHELGALHVRVETEDTERFVEHVTQPY